MFANAVEEDTVIADCIEARLPLLCSPALLRAQVEVIVRLQRRQAAEDLAGNMQDRFTLDEFNRIDVERVAVEADDGVFLGGGTTGVAGHLVSAMRNAQPLFPLRQFLIEHRGEDRFFRGESCHG